MALLVTYFLLAVVVSFFCSLLEAVLLSVTYLYIAITRKEKPKLGRKLKHLKDNIDQPLAAILSLNTIANTVGAAGVGAQVMKVYGNDYLALGSAILTFVILIFSEIIPKTIGANYWKKLAPLAANTVSIMIFVLYPIIVLLNKVSSMFGKKQFRKMTREEMIVSAELGEIDGTLLKKETAIIKNLLRLHNIFVKDVMTPRSVVMMLPRDMNVDEVTDKYEEIPFSRIPLFDKNPDNVVGLVLRNEILEEATDDNFKMKMQELLKPIARVNQNQSIAVALDEFIRQKAHLFLVVDDNGTMVGIVTLEDAVETLLGVEIVDETDNVEDMRKLAIERWEKRKQELLRNRHSSRKITNK